MDMNKEWVCGQQTVGFFSILAVDTVHWCALIRLWVFVLWIIVFLSLPQSLVRASLPTWCYYGVIGLPSFPVSAAAVNAPCKGGKRFDIYIFFLCVHGCVHVRLGRQLCVWDSTIHPVFTKTGRQWPRISKAADMIKNISDVREDLYFYHSSTNELNIFFNLTLLFSFFWLSAGEQFALRYSFSCFFFLWGSPGLNSLRYDTTVEPFLHPCVSCHNTSLLYVKAAKPIGLMSRAGQQ